MCAWWAKVGVWGAAAQLLSAICSMLSYLMRFSLQTQLFFFQQVLVTAKQGMEGKPCD